MRVTIIAVGSTGDVQPCVALGRQLRAAGYQVRVATQGRFEPLVRAVGLEYAPVAGDPQAILRRDEGQRWLETRHNPTLLVRRMLAAARPEIQHVLDDIWAASQDAELLIYRALVSPAAQSIADKLGIPSALQSNYPVAPATAFTPFFAPPFPHLGKRVERIYNGLLSRAAWPAAMELMLAPLNEWRQRTLDLPPISAWTPWRAMPRPQLTLFSWSPHILPKPAEWGQAIAVTGYWFLERDPDWRPPAALRAFLAAGPPPISIGFGSMVARDPRATLATVLTALEQTGQRAVLLSGWGGFATTHLPDSVFLTESIPHDWLFPQLAAAVHHGGSGTTHASLRAGLPTIVTPFFADQHLWGRRVAQLGVGPAPVPHAELTADRLAVAIHRALADPAMRKRAALLGRQIQSEQSLNAAIQAIERTVRRSAAPIRQ